MLGEGVGTDLQTNRTETELAIFLVINTRLREMLLSLSLRIPVYGLPKSHLRSVVSGSLKFDGICLREISVCTCPRYCIELFHQIIFGLVVLCDNISSSYVELV